MGDNCSSETEIRSEILYYEDGDIVLSAHKSNAETNSGDPETTTHRQVTVFFRVDRVVLCRQSIVLHSLLTIPEERDANETYDGALRVHMSDDADDLAKLLRAMYDIGTLNLNAYDPEMPLKAVGVLKLAIKYEAVAVRAAIVRCLAEAWPQTLEEYDRRELIIRNAIERRSRSSHAIPYGRTVHKGFPEPASAVYLALECHIPEILPAALYRLALTDPTRRWDTPDTIDTPLGRCEHPAKWDLIRNNSDCLWRVLLGKNKLQRRRQIGHGMQLNRLRTCKDSCQESTSELDCIQLGEDDYLNVLREVEETADDGTLCAKCERMVFRKIRDERQKFWDNLTQFFELDNLYELR